MKATSPLCVVLFALLSGSVLAADGKPDADAWKIPSSKENFHVFLLMGQSNMSGYAMMLAEDRKPVPHVVKLLTKAKGKGALRWRPAAHPLHNRLKSDRFGLGIPFAIEYLKDKPGVTVGLIPVAWGGAGIDKLKKGTPTYANAIKKARHAMTRGTVKGVLWHQGESDTVTQPKADSYEQKLHQLIADLRKDLADDKLPFIAGNLAEFYGTGKDHSKPDRVKRIDKVRAVFRSLPKKVKNTGFAESTGCSSPDHHKVHFDRKSYIILGKRYAKAYAETVKKADKTPKRSVKDGAKVIKLKTSQWRIAQPKGTAIEGRLPRPILLAQLVHRNKMFDKTSKTGYYILDPSENQPRFKKVFSGPGESQYCRFVTPLFGGWGIASGEIDPEKESSGRSLFWFHLLSGRIGAKIANNTHSEWLYKTELRFFDPGGVLSKYDLKTGMLTRYGQALGSALHMDANTLLTYIELAKKRCVAQVNVSANEAVLVAPLPSSLGFVSFFDRIRPAGRRAADGLMVTTEDAEFYNYALWWYPVGGPWRKVADKVHVVKTFGGRKSWLSAEYVGNEQFAVARTVPNSTRDNSDTGAEFPQALSVTMLIDGRTGKILKETKPVLYDHNPTCNIPDDWWSKDLRPKPKPKADPNDPRRLFRWDEKDKTVRYGKDKIFKTRKDSAMQMSADGRHLVVYRKWSSETAVTTLQFDILNGQSGRHATATVSTKAKTLFVNSLSWLSLCPETVTEKAFVTFTAPPHHPWHDPWR
jgi:hypothetical protein